MDLFGVESWRSAPGRCARASSCAGSTNWRRAVTTERRTGGAARRPAWTARHDRAAPSAARAAPRPGSPARCAVAHAHRARPRPTGRRRITPRTAPRSPGPHRRTLFPVAEPVRAHPGCEGRPVHGLGLPGVDGDGLRDRRAPRLRRRRGHGLDRPGQPGHRGAAPALRLPPDADPRRARALPADHPAGVVHRPVGQAPAGPGRPPRGWARRTVVVHPPFRWQRQYARDFVARHLADGGRDGRAVRRREHVPVALPRPRDARVRPRLGRHQGRLPALHGRPLAHRDRPHRRPGDGRPDGRPARATSTSPTAAAPPRTSTWSPAAAPSPAPSCWSGSPRTGFDGHVVIEVNTRRAMSARRARGRPRRGPGLHPAAPGRRRRRGTPPAR